LRRHLGARGSLQALQLDGALLDHAHYRDISNEALVEVVAANADTLHELAVGGLDGSYLLTQHNLDAVCAAARALQRFDVHTSCRSSVACRLLRQEAPYAAVRIWRLRVSGYEPHDDNSVRDVLDLASAVVAHAPLRELSLWDAPLHVPVALDAVVDAALARKLTFLAFYDCGLSPASVPALARLLSSSTALTQLRIWCVNTDDRTLLGDEPAVVAQLCAALRRNSTLATLSLVDVGLLPDDAAALALLDALAGHANGCVLRLHSHR
jgi:hypothetical protein